MDGFFLCKHSLVYLLILVFNLIGNTLFFRKRILIFRKIQNATIFAKKHLGATPSVFLRIPTHQR